MREEHLQISMVQYLRLVLPPPALVYAVPNGGLRGKREAALLKAMGVMPGVPDLVVLAPGVVLFLEVKMPKGVIAPEQKAFRAAAEAMGFAHAYVRSLDDVRDALGGAGIQTREAMP